MILIYELQVTKNNKLFKSFHKIMMQGFKQKIILNVFKKHITIHTIKYKTIQSNGCYLVKAITVSL